MRTTDLLQQAQARAASLRARLAAAYGDHDALINDAFTRLAGLATHYAATFGADTDIAVVRAPGRVNLIGEHTDYNGLPVMPMAISRDVMIAVGKAPGRSVRVTNVDGVFPDREFTIERHIPPFASGDWANYIKSATQGLIDFWNTDEGLHGFAMAATGNVPIASGLSSSAAFTIASAMALLASHGRSIDPLVFAETMARSDHYVGMASGGMDQAASVLGQAGKCLKIDFYPLRITPVKLPVDTAVVVCHSRVKAAKAGNARDEYNRRVVECRLAVALLYALAGRKDVAEPQLLSEWLVRCTGGFTCGLGQIERLLHPGGYRLDEIAKLLAMPKDTVAATLCKTKAGLGYGEPADGFQLQKRSRHVIAEAQRVEQSLAVLNAMPPDAATKFGTLMNASHDSCRDDYAISCPELEALVAAGRNAGAFAARLTGAGFGGCTVNLIKAGTARAFMQHITDAYYRPNGLDQFDDNMFEFSPASGAGVLLT